MSVGQGPSLGHSLVPVYNLGLKTPWGRGHDFHVPDWDIQSLSAHVADPGPCDYWSLPIGIQQASLPGPHGFSETPSLPWSSEVHSLALLFLCSGGQLKSKYHLKNTGLTSSLGLSELTQQSSFKWPMPGSHLQNSDLIIWNGPRHWYFLKEKKRWNLLPVILMYVQGVMTTGPAPCLSVKFCE